MATGLNNRSRRLITAVVIAALVLVASVYTQIGLENTLGLEVSSTVLAEHVSGGGG